MNSNFATYLAIGLMFLLIALGIGGCICCVDYGEAQRIKAESK